MFCKNCGKEISAGTKFCPFCGNAQNVMNKEDNSSVLDQCPYCGAVLEKENETSGAGDTLGKAIVGGLLLGPLGAVGGAAFGSKKIVCVCRKCGFRKEYKDSVEKNEIKEIKNIFS